MNDISLVILIGLVTFSMAVHAGQKKEPIEHNKDLSESKNVIIVDVTNTLNEASGFLISVPQLSVEDKADVKLIEFLESKIIKEEK
ncbi:hypothetical protein ACNZ70_001712 [Vibrio mimicus]